MSNIVLHSKSVPARRELEEAVRIAQEANREAERIEKIDTAVLEQIAARYSKYPSQVLAGIVGGAAGAAGAIGVTSAFGTALILTGPVGMSVGAALALIAYRQGSYAKVERATAQLAMALDELEHRLSRLPENAPPEVRKRLWSTYNALIRKYQDAVGPLIGK